jgi:hypothetical protein
VRRAFTARGPLLSSSELYDWCYPRRRQLNQLQRHSVLTAPVGSGRRPCGSRRFSWQAVAVAVEGQRMRTLDIAALLGEHTVRYTELAPERFKNFWRS